MVNLSTRIQRLESLVGLLPNSADLELREWVQSLSTDALETLMAESTHTSVPYIESRRELLTREPVKFMEDILGANFFPKQEDMLFSVLDHRRTSVVGANSAGKDYAAGRIILWWLYTHDQAW